VCAYKWILINIRLPATRACATVVRHWHVRLFRGKLRAGLRNMYRVNIKFLPYLKRPKKIIKRSKTIFCYIKVCVNSKSFVLWFLKLFCQQKIAKKTNLQNFSSFPVKMLVSRAVICTPNANFHNLTLTRALLRYHAVINRRTNVCCVPVHGNALAGCCSTTFSGNSRFFLSITYKWTNFLSSVQSRATDRKDSR
jgi:hypothetical protein